jgi:two-component system, OmpR family, response regulator
VDDDEDTRLLLRLVLERNGMRVVDASDGSRALELLRDDRLGEIETVITDYKMPRIDGFQLGAQLRKSYGQVKNVVLISAYLNKADVDKLNIFDKILEKPLDLADLVAYVDRFRRPKEANAQEPVKA